MFNDQQQLAQEVFFIYLLLIMAMLHVEGENTIQRHDCEEDQQGQKKI